MSEGVTDRRLEMLGEFAELALSLARDLHQAALAAEDAGEKARLAEACHRMGRGLRQSLALHARLERNVTRNAREDAGYAAQQVAEAVVRRKAQVKAAVERMVWSEYEPDDSEAEETLDRLAKSLDAEAELEGFEQQDLAAQIAEICRLIGYLPPAPPQDAAVAAAEPEPGGPFQSSA